MGVHPEKYDDKKKGRTCRNYMALIMFKKERDKYAQELVERKARLDTELAGAVTPSTPPEATPMLDLVI